VVASQWQGAAGELAGATGRVLGKAVRGRAHGGGVSGQRRSSTGRELRWPMATEARPYSVSAEEGM
jgi:hypothetical protein